MTRATPPTPTSQLPTPTPTTSTESVTELATARKDHRHPVLVGRRDDPGVAHRSARLDDRFHASFRGLIHAVAEREERIRAERRADRLEPGRFRLVHRHERRVDARHLAGADAD